MAWPTGSSCPDMRLLGVCRARGFPSCGPRRRCLDGGARTNDGVASDGLRSVIGVRDGHRMFGTMTYILGLFGWRGLESVGFGQESRGHFYLSEAGRFFAAL